MSNSVSSLANPKQVPCELLHMQGFMGIEMVDWEHLLRLSTGAIEKSCVPEIRGFESSISTVIDTSENRICMNIHTVLMGFDGF